MRERLPREPTSFGSSQEINLSLKGFLHGNQEYGPEWPGRMPRLFSIHGYLISCSRLSNSAVEKKSPSVMSSPSHNFLIVMIDKSLRLLSIILYTVDGVTPDRVASSFALMPLALQTSRKRLTTASFTVIESPHRVFRFCDAFAYTHLRIFEKYVTI